MSLKRANVIPDIYKNSKRRCTIVVESSAEFNDDEDGTSVFPVISDTKAAMIFVKEQFPLAKLEYCVPALFLQHQLYSIVKNRTMVDMEVEELRNAGEVRLFKLGCDTDDICIIFTEDYNKHVTKFNHGRKHEELVNKFLTEVLPCNNDLCVSHDLLIDKHKFTDSDITGLINAGVLTVRDVGSWWLAIPGAGIFMRYFIKGRKAIIAMIKRCKYREILLNVLEKRQLPKSSVFGMSYHIHDIIGASLVTCMDTTSGVLLRHADD